MSNDLNSKLLSNEELDRKNTFTRKQTFSRAFTFDGTHLKSNVTGQFEGITRTLTEVGNYIDPDARVTNAIIIDYVHVAEKGNEGDMPFPPGFGNKFKFWKVIFFSGLVACFMGVAAAAFMNIGDEVPKQWCDCDFTNDNTCGDWYNGKKWWICVTAGTGLAVGLLRWLFSYPDNLPGIFKDIQSFHVDPKWIPLTYLLSAMSLAGGASLGPEQALGNLGGGIAYFIQEHIDFEDDDYKKIFVLCGMASALGALFPSPLLGALMMHELGEPPGSFMESTVMLSFSACICFAVYYEMIGATFLDYLTDKGISLSGLWLEDPGYQNWQFGTGFIIGVIAAGLCLMCTITIGICKQLFFRLRTRLESKPFLREVLPPVIGGFCIGTVNWALPATVGNGNIMFPYIIKAALNGGVSQRLLVCTGFARMFLLGVSMNCGFVGGMIFPFLTMGMIAGTIMYLNYSFIPLGLCSGTFMIAICCGIVPMPFTFTCLSVFMFFFGTYQTVPIFVASITSYLIVCGSGLMDRIANGRKKDENAAIDEQKQAAQTKEKEKQEADEFALKQYLGSKRNAEATPATFSHSASGGGHH